MKKLDYKGWCKHVDELTKRGFPVDLSDLDRLSKLYNCPIPKRDKNYNLDWAGTDMEDKTTKT